MLELQKTIHEAAVIQWLKKSSSLSVYLLLKSDGLHQ